MNKAMLILCLAVATGVQAQTRTGGNRAYDVGRYDLALKKYQGELRYAEKTGDTQLRATALYGMAKSSAQLCKTAEAEALFRESITVREGIPDDPQIAYMTQNWIEFGRFLFTNHRPEEAATYFAKAVPRLESLGIETMDPIGYAEFLDTYVAALKATANNELAETLSLKASELRAKYPGQVAHFQPVPYPADCKPK